MKIIDWREHPKHGVNLSSPDGAYYQCDQIPPSAPRRRWQIVVVGTMFLTPGEYVDILAQHKGLVLEIVDISFLTPAGELSPAHQNDIRRRGFVSIMLEEVEASVRSA